MKKNVIPNPAGLPCNESDSKQVQAAIKKWKNIRNEKKGKVQPEMSYWQIQSLNTAL